jgi:hypothetical protein
MKDQKLGIPNEFTNIQNLPTSSPFRLANQVDVNMKGLHPYFKRALKQLAKNYNGYKKKRGRGWEGVTQIQTANFCSFHGIVTLESLRGFKKLRTIDRVIEHLGGDDNVETWLATVKVKTKGFMGGNERWVGKIYEEIKTWYFSVSSDFHLPGSIILQLGIGSVLMQAPPHLVRQKYRDEFRNQIFSFADWIKHRVKEGQELIRKIRQERTINKRRPVYQIDWERDVLQFVNKKESEDAHI